MVIRKKKTIVFWVFKKNIKYKIQNETTCENLLKNPKHLNNFSQVLNVELLPEIPSLKPCLVSSQGWRVWEFKLHHTLLPFGKNPNSYPDTPWRD